MTSIVAVCVVSAIIAYGSAKRQAGLFGLVVDLLYGCIGLAGMAAYKLGKRAAA